MQRLMALGVLIILAGFALVVAGSSATGSASIGGVIFIGPIPLVFGSGPGGWDLAIGSVIIGVAMIVLLALWGRRFSQS